MPTYVEARVESIKSLSMQTFAVHVNHLLNNNLFNLYGLGKALLVSFH